MSWIELSLPYWSITWRDWLLLVHAVLVIIFSLRILLRDDFSPDARMAWIMVLVLLPLLGCIVYFLFGEVDIGYHETKKYQHLFAENRALLRQGGATGSPEALESIEPLYQLPFHYLQSINGLLPIVGNHAELMASAEEARRRLVEDIDTAQETVDILYYIWLNDTTGNHVAQALIRAAQRGVHCRVMVDGLGSRALLKTPLWQAMRQAGVDTAVALPLNRPLHTLITSRIDLRNHRKITIIDREIVYCGSQNCADEAFAIKAKFAPWVDILLRLEGPIALQMRLLFATDWRMARPNDVLELAPKIAHSEPQEGFIACAMGDGPTERSRATPQLLVSLINHARHSLTISTPYFVPDVSVLDALCSAAWRGVNVQMVFPKRNDSWVVAAASRSNYAKLLAAGVAISEFKGGLLHAKTLTIDGQISFIGSTNLDLRSFDLNYENNILLADEAITQAIFARQMAYFASADKVLAEEVLHWPFWRRIGYNIIATVGPLL